MDLDPRTLNATTTILSAIIALSIAFVADAYPTGMRRYIRTWAAALGFFAIGWGLLAARGSIPDGASVVLANLLVQLGLFGLLVALRDFLHLPRFQRRDVLPPLLVIGICSWFLYVEPHIGMRIAAITVANGVLLAEALVVLLRHAPRPAPRPYVLLAGCFAVLLVFLIARAIAQFTLAPAPALHAPNPAQAALFFVANTAPLVATLGFLLAIADRLQGRLHGLASSDPLTGLANRRHLEARARTIPAFALLAIDVDHFKPINDRHGHAAGDEVLVQLAGRLSESAPVDALVARLGGEEFVVVLPGASLDDACREAERVRSAIASRPCELDGQTLRLTVSIGVACGPGGEHGLHDALRRADLALYSAKREGRNRVVVDEGDAHARVAASAPGRARTMRG